MRDAMDSAAATAAAAARISDVTTSDQRRIIRGSQTDLNYC